MLSTEMIVLNKEDCWVIIQAHLVIWENIANSKIQAHELRLVVEYILCLRKWQNQTISANIRMCWLLQDIIIKSAERTILFQL